MSAITVNAFPPLHTFNSSRSWFLALIVLALLAYGLSNRLSALLGPPALKTVDVATGEAAVAHHQRSDVCAVPAAGIVAEAMVALVLADAVLEKFGGDSVVETRRNRDAFLAGLR